MKNKNINFIKSLLERRKKFGKSQKHLYHMVTPSPWPFMGSMSALILTIGAVMYMHKYIYGIFFLILGLLSVISTMFFWWRDIILEATFGGYHTKCVVAGLRLGMILFILSEVMFFFSFFWAFFHASLAPSIVLGGIWPPLELQILNPFHIPLLNTLILLTSGVTVTLSHYWVCTPKQILLNFFRINYNFALVLINDKISINVIKYLNGFENKEIENIWTIYYDKTTNQIILIPYNFLEKIKQIFYRINNFILKIINSLNSNIESWFKIIINKLYLFWHNFKKEFNSTLTICLGLYPLSWLIYKEALSQIDKQWNEASDIIDDYFDEELALDAFKEFNKENEITNLLIKDDEIGTLFIDNVDKELHEVLSPEQLKKFEEFETYLVSMRFFLESFAYLKKISPIDWWIVFAYLIITRNLIKIWFSLISVIWKLMSVCIVNYFFWPIWVLLDEFLIYMWDKLEIHERYLNIKLKILKWVELYKDDSFIQYWLIFEIYNPHRQTIQKWTLWITILLALEFTIWQGFEYYDALFYITDGIYGSTFYVTTGFHGLHVIIGTIFLIVCCVRLQLHHFRYNHHFGYEAAIWYRHFVDVVWLFLFMFIYIWGSGI